MYGCRKARAGSTWKNGTDAATAPTLAGRECRAGLDLSTTTDLSALALVFRDGDDGYTLLPFAFCPADTIHERQRRDRGTTEHGAKKDCSSQPRATPWITRQSAARSMNSPASTVSANSLTTAGIRRCSSTNWSTTA